MASTRKQLDEEIKLRYLEGVVEHLEQTGEEVLRIGSNKVAIPVLDSQNNERWLELTFKVPTGDRDGNEYDGYSLKQDYEMKLAEKAEKAKAKAEKAKADKAKREAKKKEKEKAEG